MSQAKAVSARSHVAIAQFTIPKRFFPWLDRQGNFSFLKAITLIGVLAPALWVAIELSLGWLQPKPITLAIHEIGDWAIRFLVASLMITPLRRIADWPKLIAVRRMLGVASFAYVLIHFTLYIVDQQWNLAVVAREIVLRIYLTIGFVTLLGLGALAATSTDAMIKRLGGARWNRLHKLIYGLATLGLVHYSLQSKLDISRALLMVGFYAFFMLHRLMQKRGLPTNFWTLNGLGIAAATLTALFEAGWYHFRNGISVTMVLGNNFNFLYGFHFSPDFEWGDLTVEWWIVALGLGLGGVNVLRRFLATRKDSKVGVA